MRRNLLLLAGALVAAAVAAPRADVRQRESTERHVYVRVTRGNEVPVQGLSAGDFVVREDDIAREVLRVAPAPPPSHISLLIDNTGELQPLLIELRSSLLAFVTTQTALPAPPLMSLTTLAERPTTLVDFTTSDIALENGIKRVFPRTGSGSYFLEGIIETCQSLRKAGAERPAIVAFVIDSSPIFSNQLHTRVADALKEAGASLWTIELQQQGGPALSFDARERTRVVNDVTTWSGGANKRTLSKQGLTKTFADLAAAMASRYDVTYGRPAALIPPSRLAVEVRDRSLRVTAPRWTGR
jgi:hypothetical protein